MNDITTQSPLRVLSDGKTAPYMMAPVSQLEDIRCLLSSRNISYSVDEHAISLNGSPYIATINFSRGADVTAIQAVLDSAH